jgi:protein TonB
MAEMQPTLEQDDSESAKRFIFPAVMAVVMIVGCWLIYKSLGSSSGHEPKRQTVKIAVLPDTPPPPPPPPKEKPPEPKEQDNKPQPQEQQKPQEAPPEAQQLKMDGPAGDGPSAFAAGSVNSEYKGGEIGSGTGGGAPVNRLQFALFSSQLQKHIQKALAKAKEVKGADYRVNVQVWLDGSGQFQRVELLTPTGDQVLDEALKQAFAQLPAMEGVPSNLPQPVRLRISNRLTG